MWNVFFRLSDIQRKLSLQIFHAFCEFVIIIMLALGGCLAETLLSKFNSHHCLGFSVFHHDLCLGGWGGGGVMLLLNNTFTTSSLVSGGI